jgi:membrane protein required for colicin V production
VNWLDFVLVAGLLVALILGSKIGLVRSVMRFFALAAGIIITTNNADIIAIEVARHIDASPMIIAIISFIILLAILYGLFRLVVIMFYKVSQIQSLGRTDKIGGGVMGVARGWIFFGFLFFILALMPMPDAFHRMVDNSMLSESMMRSITFLYDGTKVLHPESRSFVDQVQNSLQETNKTRFDSIGEPENSFERQRANDAVREKMQVIQRYFGPVQREQT